MRREDAEKTTWMILEGLGCRKAENPELEQISPLLVNEMLNRLHSGVLERIESDERKT